MHGVPEARRLLMDYLEEDLRSGDITTEALCPAHVDGVGTIYSKGRAVLAGAREVATIAGLMGLEFEGLVSEGDWVGRGEPVVRLSGQVATLLQVERLCLNIVMHMSGIATKTRTMVERVRDIDLRVTVAATRKTTPGFRYFEKRAVRVGGGDPHRYALDDMVLIKNNHIAVVGGVREAIVRARATVSFTKRISCEVRNTSEAVTAARAGADIILLDNLTPEEVLNTCQVLQREGLRDRVVLEVSGGIDEGNIESYARTGIDVISVGALTHSYHAADFNMEVVVQEE